LALNRRLTQPARQGRASSVPLGPGDNGFAIQNKTRQFRDRESFHSAAQHSFAKHSAQELHGIRVAD
jgi:hypothetical protein